MSWFPIVVGALMLALLGLAWWGLKILLDVLMENDDVPR